MVQGWFAALMVYGSDVTPGLGVGAFVSRVRIFQVVLGWSGGWVIVCPTWWEHLLGLRDDCIWAQLPNCGIYE